MDSQGSHKVRCVYVCECVRERWDVGVGVGVWGKSARGSEGRGWWEGWVELPGKPQDAVCVCVCAHVCVGWGGVVV